MISAPHDLRRALDANANGTRMHNRVIVYVRVYIYYMYVRVHGAELRMCLVRPPGRRLCGAYAVAVGVIARELVVACSACARALKLQVDVITRRKGSGVCTYAWVRCSYGV